VVTLLKTSFIHSKVANDVHPPNTRAVCPLTLAAAAAVFQKCAAMARKAHNLSRLMKFS
jgi:hypothetical protein